MEEEDISSDSDYDGDDYDDEAGSSEDDEPKRKKPIGIPSMKKLSIKQDLNESFQSRMEEDNELKTQKYTLTFYDTSPKKIMEKIFFGLDDLSVVKLALAKEMGVDYKVIELFYSQKFEKRIGPDLLCVNDFIESLQGDNEKKVFVKSSKK